MLGPLDGGVAAREAWWPRLLRGGHSRRGGRWRRGCWWAWARLANGCTSGHGVCGVSRLSARSLAATATFIATGALTVFLTGGAR
ncbi:MAG: hypothetical protein U0324_27455 [Polyangiales bacterium]